MAQRIESANDTSLLVVAGLSRQIRAACALLCETEPAETTSVTVTGRVVAATDVALLRALVGDLADRYQMSAELRNSEISFAVTFRRAY